MEEEMIYPREENSKRSHKNPVRRTKLSNRGRFIAFISQGDLEPSFTFHSSLNEANFYIKCQLKLFLVNYITKEEGILQFENFKELQQCLLDGYMSDGLYFTSKVIDSHKQKIHNVNIEEFFSQLQKDVVDTLKANKQKKNFLILNILEKRGWKKEIIKDVFCFLPTTLAQTEVEIVGESSSSDDEVEEENEISDQSPQELLATTRLSQLARGALNIQLNEQERSVLTELD